jgi:hypothetical protein
VLTLLTTAILTEWAFDDAFFAGAITPEVLGGGRGTLAPMMASVAFGGPDLRTVCHA